MRSSTLRSFRQLEALPIDVTRSGNSEPTHAARVKSRGPKGAPRRRPMDMVLEFHRVFQLSMGLQPALPHLGLTQLRYDLIEEELLELKAALAAGDLVEVADALGDIVYVTYGAAVSFGIDLDLVLLEIHRSNMSKLAEDGTAIFDDRGKVVKGPNYSPPDLRPFTLRSRSLGRSTSWPRSPVQE